MMTFLGYESSASMIRNFEPLRIPGLLQTEAYARAVLDHHYFGDGHVEDRVNLRLDRQAQLLGHEDGPQCHFVIDEGVLHRPVGGIEVMREQLGHLLEIRRHPRVNLRIVPLLAGLNSRVNVGYAIFEFAHPEDGVVLSIENPQHIIIRENSEVTEPINFLEDFWRLEQIAPLRLAVDLVKAAIRHLDGDSWRPE
jgi:hypothetical protein